MTDTTFAPMPGDEIDRIKATLAGEAWEKKAGQIQREMLFAAGILSKTKEQLVAAAVDREMAETFGQLILALEERTKNLEAACQIMTAAAARLYVVIEAAEDVTKH